MKDAVADSLYIGLMANRAYVFVAAGVATGLALAAIAIVVEAYFGGGAYTAALFWAGWCVMTAAMIAGMFVFESELPLAQPLKLAAVGVVTVILALVMEAVSGEPMMTLSRLGALVMLLGIGWGLWAIGGRR